MTTPADFVLDRVATSTAAVNADTITVDKPAGTAAGDLLVALVVRNTTTDPKTVPSGWTLLAANKPTNAWRLYYRVAGASEPDNYTWTWSAGVNYYTRVLMAAYRGGFDPADPIDAYSNTAYTTSDDKLRAAGATAGADNSGALVVGAVFNNPAQAVTFTPPAGWTEDYDGGDRWRCSLSHRQIDAGATGDIDVTMSGSYTAKHAFLVILNPRPFTPPAEEDWTPGRILYVLRQVYLLAGSVIDRSILTAANKVFVRVKDSAILESAVYNDPEDPLSHTNSPREAWVIIPSGDETTAQVVASVTLTRRREGAEALSGLAVALKDGLELERGQLLGVQIDRLGLSGTYPIRELTYDLAAAQCHITVGDWAAPKSDTDSLVALAQRLEKLEREA